MGEIAMVKEADPEAASSKGNIWSTSMRCWLCVWMMKVTNQDMLKAAENGDVDMLKSCVECGAWMDFTRPDDKDNNTALHFAVMHCTDYAEYLAEAERLGLKVDPEKGCVDLQSKLKPKSREAKKQLQEDIKQWEEKHINDMACIEALCEGNAEPRTVNADGKTPIDLAAPKDPAILKRLQSQTLYLDDLKKQ